MKFYTFDQNNSGGYYIQNDTFGICEVVIIEANNASTAWEKLKSLEDEVPNLFNYCGCCGERWSNWNDDNDGTETPCIYDTPLEEVKQSVFTKRAFVHYLDGSFKEFKLITND